MATKLAKKKSYVFPVVVIIILIFAGIGLVLKARDNFTIQTIAVIPLNGQIGINGAVDSRTIVNAIQKADKEFTVKAIILDINSPGGSVVATKEIADAVKNAKKPTVALIREVGASGGFWVATSADKIVADSTSIVGSIGVTASYLDFVGLMEKYGINYNQLSSGKFKETGSQFKELTPEEERYLMEKINFIKNSFVAEISANRNLTFEEVDKLADGGIWLGAEAKEFGMVDYLGGEQTAKQVAEQLAGIKDSKLLRVEIRRNTFADLLTGETSLGYWMGRGIGDSLRVGSSKNLQIDA